MTFSSLIRLSISACRCLSISSWSAERCSNILWYFACSASASLLILASRSDLVTILIESSASAVRDSFCGTNGGKGSNC